MLGRQATRDRLDCCENAERKEGGSPYTVTFTFKLSLLTSSFYRRAKNELADEARRKRSDKCGPYL